MLNLRHVFLLIILATGLTVTFIIPPFPQSIEFHDFADSRQWLGIPNAMDVLSNLGFVIVGLLGLRAARIRNTRSAIYSTWLTGYSLSLLLVAAGSAYYHLAPNHLGLLWDRAAMTIAFSFYFCLVMASQVSLPLAKKLLPLMLLTGPITTLQWYLSEVSGAGDLRFYAAFQFLPMILAILMLALFPAGALSRRWLALTLAGYLAAKLLEIADVSLFQQSGFVSGHTLKHLVAALASWCVIPAVVQGMNSKASIRPRLYSV